MEDLSQELKRHTADDALAFASLNGVLDLLRNNHLVHIQADILDIKVGMAKNNSDTEWIKKILLPALIAIVVGLVGLFFKT